MLDEKRTIREAYGRGGGFARFPSELTSALSFPSSLSPRDRYCPSRLPSLLLVSAPFLQ